MGKRLGILLLVVVMLGGGYALGGEGHRKKRKLPKGVRGFSGMVRGVVVKKGDRNTIFFKVGRLLKVWDGNKAKTPKSIVGLTVWVGPRWVKGDGGKWRPLERHVAFLKKLKKGAELTLEIRNGDGDWFHILELPKEDGECKEGKKDGECKKGKKEGEHKEGGEKEGKGDKETALPKSLHGFSGMVRGVVVKKGDRNAFFFKVCRLVKTWKGNKAKNPRAIVGLTVKVGPRWKKGKRGKWHPLEMHVAFIRMLKKGQELTLEIAHAERDVFHILELSEEQRKMVKKHCEKHEGNKDGGKCDKGDKKDGEGEGDAPPPDKDIF